MGDAGRIEVELAELSAASGHLVAAHSVISEWKARRSEIEAGTAWSGLERVTRAIEGFLGEWNYGFDHLDDDIEALARALDGAVVAYS